MTNVNFDPAYSIAKGLIDRGYKGDFSLGALLKYLWRYLSANYFAIKVLESIYYLLKK